MLKRFLISLLVAQLVHPIMLTASQATRDLELESGIRQAQEGDFETAIPILDTVVRRLSSDKTRARDLARAYTYLAIAYLGLSQELMAKAKFVEALKTDQSLELSAREFPPKILTFFEEAKKDANLPPVPVALPPSPAPSAAASPQPIPKGSAKKGGSGRIVVVALAGAAVAGVAAAVAGGGGSNTTPTVPSTTNPPSTTTTTTTTTTTEPPAPPAPTCSVPPPSGFKISPSGGGARVSGVITIECLFSNPDCVDRVTITAPGLSVGRGGPPFSTQWDTRNAANGSATLTCSATFLDPGRTTVDVQSTVTVANSVEVSPYMLTWVSELDVPASTGQVVINGTQVSFHPGGRSSGLARPREAANHMEGVLVDAKGPGRWRFEMGGAFRRGSLRVIAGDVELLTENVIIFRVRGRPGERITFAFLDMQTQR